MTLTAQSVSDVMSAFLGKALLKHDCEALAKRLGSSEELFAWLFLRHEHGGDVDPSLLVSMKEIAVSSVGRAVTKRAEAGFPLQERRARLELDARIGTILADDAKHRRSASEHVYEALVDFGKFSTDPARDIRLSLGPKLP